MRIHLFLLLFCSVSVASFAQKYGVDIGYAYTINQFKDVSGNDPRLSYIQSDLKQKAFPNISVRPYIKLYKKVYLYFGVDLVRYEFKHSLYFSDAPYYNYSRRLVTSELHIPAMLRGEMIKFNQKHILSIYGGMFYRYPVWTKARILEGSGGYDSIPAGNSNSGIYIREKKQQFTNFVAGIHQTFFLADCIHGYIDFQMKYMPGYFYVPGSGILRFEPMHIENKFAFSFTIGVSLLKPYKEKTPYNNPARLND